MNNQLFVKKLQQHRDAQRKYWVDDSYLLPEIDDSALNTRLTLAAEDNDKINLATFINSNKHS